MRLVDSIPAVEKIMKALKKLDVKHFTSDGHGNVWITETAKRLGISREWLGQNLKFDREAPEELKKAVPGTPTNRDLSKSGMHMPLLMI